jgi:anti-anti-sigma regulatory factor
MLRIEFLPSDDSSRQPTLRLSGQLTGPWVDELARAIDTHAESGCLVLDLTEVSFADSEGIQLLRSLHAQGGVSLRCSAIVAAQVA